jgi:hypothetical protein
MTQHRAAHPIGQKCLAWLLLIAVAFMGLTITRQQALGSLHGHADQGPRISSVLTTALSSLASDWVDRWQEQKAFGHGQLLPAIFHGADVLSHAPVYAQAHDHSALERHHHVADDVTVIALDGAAATADAADSSTLGGSLLLPIVWTPAAGLVLHAIAEQTVPWPVGRFVAFASRTVPPLLRPPSL